MAEPVLHGLHDLSSQLGIESALCSGSMKSWLPLDHLGGLHQSLSLTSHFGSFLQRLLCNALCRVKRCLVPVFPQEVTINVETVIHWIVGV